jgi:hypothetical protein
VNTGEISKFKSNHFCVLSIKNLFDSSVPTDKEIRSAIKIQSNWRGHYVRLVKRSRTPGTQENNHTTEQLKKSWVTVDSNLNDNSLFLFR